MRRGATLLEVLTVVGVVSVLAAMVLPAVVRVRESSRRSICAANLRSLGAAVAQYESVFRQYPSGRLASATPSTTNHATVESVRSPLTAILPYLERSDCFDQLNLEAPGPSWDLLSTTLHPNASVARARVAQFVCPSDGPVGTLGCVNYRFCTGRSPYPWMLEASTRGAFPYFDVVSSANVVDGLSFTAAASERLVGDGDSSAYDASRDHGFLTGGVVPDEAALLAAWESGTAPKQPHFSFSGATWLLSGYECTLYNHAAPPNAVQCDLAHGPGGPDPDHGVQTFGGTFPARSLHPGGVQCLMLDGSVRWTQSAIDLDLWRAIATIGGGEPQ